MGFRVFHPRDIRNDTHSLKGGICIFQVQHHFLVSVRGVKIFHAAICLVGNCRMKIETITSWKKKTSLPVPLPNEMGRSVNHECSFVWKSLERNWLSSLKKMFLGEVDKCPKKKNANCKLQGFEVVLLKHHILWMENPPPKKLKL